MGIVVEVVMFFSMSAVVTGIVIVAAKFLI
jgi:hypothetical protein